MNKFTKNIINKIINEINEEENRKMLNNQLLEPLLKIIYDKTLPFVLIIGFIYLINLIIIIVILIIVLKKK